MEAVGVDVLVLNFNGRALRILGYRRQRIPGNWKLMQENIKDPYHPGLLHTWFVTFGLWRADQKSRMVMDEQGRHAVMISRRNEGGGGAVTQGSFWRVAGTNEPASPSFSARLVHDLPSKRLTPPPQLQ